MVGAGADMIDVGGESTRPGAGSVSEKEELDRVIPVVTALHDVLDAPISIDTRKAAVAKRAVEAGASVLNDTNGEASDRALDAVAADTGAAIVIMHARGTPATMRSLTSYTDVTGDVGAWLIERARELRSSGVDERSIVLDPGFGFAKTPRQNLRLLRELDRLVELGYPLLVGTSRKSFIGEILGLPAGERVEGTTATVVWAIAQGADIVRVHDVEPLARAVRVADAIASSAR
jgi:dihydropteroate synthase